jgi:hypothetical protein
VTERYIKYLSIKMMLCLTAFLVKGKMYEMIPERFSCYLHPAVRRREPPAVHPFSPAADSVLDLYADISGLQRGAAEMIFMPARCRERGIKI